MIYDPSPRNPQLLHMDSVRGMAERHTLMHNLAQKSLSLYIQQNEPQKAQVLDHIHNS